MSEGNVTPTIIQKTESPWTSVQQHIERTPIDQEVNSVALENLDLLRQGVLRTEKRSPFEVDFVKNRKARIENFSLLRSEAQKSPAVSLNSGLKEEFPNDLLRLMGHLYGDTFIGKSELEGWTAKATARFYGNALLKLQQGKPPLDIISDSLINSIKEIHLFAKKTFQPLLLPSETNGDAITWQNRTPEDALKDITKLAEQARKKVSNLKPGESFAMPGGWAGDPGHGMVYIFSKNEDGTLEIEICNSGAGTRFHGQLLRRMKREIQPVLRFSNVDPKKILFSGEGENSFFTPLIAARILPLVDNGIIFNADHIYTFFLPLLKEYKSSADQSLTGFVGAQRSGTCAFKCLEMVAFSRLGSRKFHKMRFHMCLSNLVPAYNDLEAILKEDTVEGDQAREVMRKSARYLRGQVAKRFRPDQPGASVINQDVASQALATTMDILDRLDEIDENLQKKRIGSTQKLSVGFQNSNFATKRSELAKNTSTILAPRGKFQPSLPELPGKAPVERPGPKQLKNQLLTLEREIAPRLLGDIAAKRRVEEWINILPIPDLTKRKDYWLQVESPLECLKLLEKLMEHYNLLVLQADEPLLPEQINAILGVYSMIHALAVRIDGGKLELGKYRIAVPKKLLLDDPFQAFFDPQTTTRRKKLVGYFLRTKNQDKLFDNRRSAKGFKTDDFNNENLKGELLLYKRLLEKYPQIEKTRFSHTNVKYRKNPKMKLRAYAELFCDTGHEDGLMKSVGLDHLALLKRASYFLWGAFTDESNTTLYSRQVEQKSSLVRHTGELTRKRLKIYNFEFDGKSIGSYNMREKTPESHPILKKAWDLRTYISANRTERDPNKESTLEAKALKKEDSLACAISIVDNAPSELLYWAQEHIDELKDPATQLKFNLFLFRTLTKYHEGKHPLMENLKAGNTLRRQCEKLLKKAFEQLDSGLDRDKKSNLETLLFFIDLSSHLNHFLRPQNTELAQTDRARSLLNRWAKRRDLPTKIQASIQLHRIYHFASKPIEKLDKDEAKMVVESWVRFQLKQNQSQQHPPHLKAQAERYVLDVLRGRPEAYQDIGGLLLEILQEENLTNMPQEPLASDSKGLWWNIGAPDSGWNLSLVTGRVTTPDGPLTSLAENPLKRNEFHYQRLFGDRTFDFYQVGKSYRFKDPELGRFRFANSGDNKRGKPSVNERPQKLLERGKPSANELLQRLLERGKPSVNEGLQRFVNGNWRRYLGPDMVHKGGVPRALIYDYHHWAGDDGILITESTGKPIALVALNGAIYELNEKGEKTGNRLEAYVAAAKTKTRLSDFERDTYIIYTSKGEVVPKEGQLPEEIRFSRYRSLANEELRFEQDNGALIWTANPNYRLLRSRPGGLLARLPNFLALTSLDGNKLKLLVPLQPMQKIKKTKAFSRIGKLDVRDQGRAEDEKWEHAPLAEYASVKRGEKRYIELDYQKGELQASTAEGTLMLAYIHLQNREYVAATACLRQVSANEPLSKEALQVLTWIAGLENLNRDDSPNARGVRLLARVKTAEQLVQSKITKDEREEKPNPLAQKLKKQLLDYVDIINHINTEVELTLEEECKAHQVVSILGKMPPLLKSRLKFLESKTTYKEPKRVVSDQYNKKRAPTFSTIPYYLDRRNERSLWANAGSDLEDDIKWLPKRSWQKASVCSLSELLGNTSEHFWGLYQTAISGTDAQKGQLYILFKTVVPLLTTVDLRIINNEDLNLIKLLLIAYTYPKQHRILDSDASVKKRYDWCEYALRTYRRYSKDNRIHLPPPKSRKSTWFPYLDRDEEKDQTLASKTQTQEPTRFKPYKGKVQALKKPLNKKTLLFEPKSLKDLKEMEFCGDLQMSALCQRARSEKTPTYRFEETKAVTEKEKEIYGSAIKHEVQEFKRDFETGAKQLADRTHDFLLKDGVEVKQIGKQLTVKREELDKTLWRREGELLQLANKKSVEEKMKLYQLAREEAKTSKKLDLRDLVYLFLKGNEGEYTEANGNLSKSESKQLHQAIGEYLQIATYSQRLQRASKLTAKIDAITDEKDLDRSSFIQQLGQELEKTRTYKLSEHPEYLVFEYLSGFLLRPKQVTLLNRLQKTDENGEYENCVAQLIMGGGKTSVLAALLGVLGTRTGKASVFLCPPELFSQVKDNIRKTQRRCFRQEITPLTLLGEAKGVVV